MFELQTEWIALGTDKSKFHGARTRREKRTEIKSGTMLLTLLTARGARPKEEPMAKRSIAERLAQLEAQRKNLQSKLGKQERARDTRRKVLLGALVLHRLEKGQDEFSKKLGDWLNKELPGFLSRDDDKALFADLVTPPGEDAAKA